MNRRGTGVTFCFIAAFLTVGKYIAAAIYVQPWLDSGGAMYFKESLKYVGGSLTKLSVISVIIGIGYIIWAEISEANVNK